MNLYCAGILTWLLVSKKHQILFREENPWQIADATHLRPPGGNGNGGNNGDGNNGNGSNGGGGGGGGGGSGTGNATIADNRPGVTPPPGPAEEPPYVPHERLPVIPEDVSGPAAVILLFVMGIAAFIYRRVEEIKE